MNKSSITQKCGEINTQVYYQHSLDQFQINTNACNFFLIIDRIDHCGETKGVSDTIMSV